jgi:MFS family permease
MPNLTNVQLNMIRSWSILFTLTGSFFRQTADASVGIMVGLYLSYINSYITPVSALQVGLVGIAFNATILIFGPIFGALSDLRGRKVFMVIGPLIGAAVVQVYPLTTALPLILIAMVFEGFTGAFETPSAVGFLADVTPDASRSRGRAMALFEIVSAIGTALGYLAGGILWDYMGQNAFRILSVVYIGGAIIFFFGVREDFRPVQRAPRTVRYYRSLLTSRKVVSFSPAWLAMVAITTAWLSQAPFQLSGEITATDQSLMGGFSGTQISLIFLITGITLTLGMYVWGSASAIFNKINILLLSVSGVFGFCIALYFLNHVDLASRGLTNPQVIIISLVLLSSIFITSGFTPVALAYLSDISDEVSADRGMVLGVFLGVLLGGSRIVGSWLAGVFADWRGVDGIIVLTAALAGLGLLTIFWIKASE